MRLNKLAKKIFAAGLAVSLMMANAGIGLLEAIRLKSRLQEQNSSSINT